MLSDIIFELNSRRFRLSDETVPDTILREIFDIGAVPTTGVKPQFRIVRNHYRNGEVCGYIIAIGRLYLVELVVDREGILIAQMV